MIALLSPMESEIKHSLERIGGPRRSKKIEAHKDLRFVNELATAPLSGNEQIFFGTTGVGKVTTALAVEEVLLRLAPRLVLFGGLGGSLTADLEPGHAVVANEVLQWDMDVSAAGIQRGIVPFLDGKEGLRSGSLVELDSAMREAALRSARSRTHAVEAKVASGDTLLGREADDKKRRIAEETGALLVDMEGWPAAYACSVREVPMVLLRIVSDTVGETGPMHLRKRVNVASELIAEIFAGILEEADG